MKKMIFFLIFLPSIINAQKPIIDRLAYSAMIIPISWDMWYQYHKDEYKPFDPSDIVKQLNDSFEVARFASEKKYAESSKKMISSITLFGGNLATYIHPGGEINVSINTFGEAKDKVFLIDGAVSDNVFNTLRTTAKQRAAEVLKKNIIPASQMVDKKDFPVGIKYLALSFTYGSKDFSNSEDLLNLKPEYICALLPFADLQKFNNSEITLDDLIAKSTIFMRDRDSHNIAKMTISIN